MVVELVFTASYHQAQLPGRASPPTEPEWTPSIPPEPQTLLIRIHGREFLLADPTTATKSLPLGNLPPSGESLPSTKKPRLHILPLAGTHTWSHTWSIFGTERRVFEECSGQPVTSQPGQVGRAMAPVEMLVVLAGLEMV